MPVTNQETTEFAGIYTTKPPVLVSTTSWHGRLRMAYFVHDQIGTGDAGSSVALIKLPAGTVRLILPLSYIYVNWTTASATLDLGWDAYTDLNGTAVLADPDGLVDGLDVETADVFGAEELTTLAGLAATAWTRLFQSKEGVTIRATAPGVIAAGDDISGVFAYVQD